jgi:hypothetical protein
VFAIEGEKLSKKTKPVVDITVPKEDAFFVFHYVNMRVEK